MNYKKCVKILITIFGLLLFSSPASAATCAWKELKTSSTYSGPGSAPITSTSGGCSATEKQGADSACKQGDKPNYSTNSGSQAVCCCAPDPKAAAPMLPKYEIPTFQINIPTVKLTDPTCESDDEGSQICSVPWLGEYTVGIYSYLLGIAGILATIILMAAGLLWLASGGDASRITTAKEMIIGSISGLIILSSAYLILYQINPALTKYGGLKIGSIKRIDLFSTPIAEQTTAPASGSGAHGVPLYFQCSNEGKATLYDNNGKCQPDKSQLEKYGAGKSPNICTSGCGVVSTWMVLAKYGKSVSLATWTKNVTDSGGRTCGSGSNAAGLMKAAQLYGLKGESLSGISSISSKLDAGYPVIISVRGPCTYTQGGHFIVLTGWKDKSKKIADVNDPFNHSLKPERTSISLDTLSGCTLGQAFYLRQ